MGEYNNLEGFEVTSKTRNKWTYIPRSDTSYGEFELPPLFKAVSSLITLYLLGFLLILGMESYATFGIALNEGVPIEIISFLVLLDILFAYLPHLLDGKINQKENLLFVARYSSQFTREGSEDEKTDLAASKGLFERQLKSLRFKKILCYVPLIVSVFVKLFLFFQTYPFFDTYQAYIVIASYTIGAILHILCTGKLLMYCRFRLSLRSGRSDFESSHGTKNFYDIKKSEENLLNTKELLTIKNKNHNQNLTLRDGKYYLQTKGILFDEELNDLISDQSTKQQKLSVAVAGKILQLSQLGKDVISDGGKPIQNKN